MTQRVDLATVMDRLAIDELITGYAVAVDDSDWTAYRGLFTRDGRADYREAGGIAGGAEEIADWLAETMRPFPVRQHLIVNRRVRIQDLGGYPGDSAEALADYVNTIRPQAPPDDAAPAGDLVSGGRCAFTLLRTEAGWRVRSVIVREKWRRAPGVLPTG
ncbi:nuclear transport factor 2 family protein [Streptomyces sp. SP18CS02]|uniref:nuclear transport factor 2 family protein n=1 Tax=Streptomyces sp. SP18CS02 TaxID=3002531 RepID=UPI002E772A37|nr:nuclear transport factor 2 family protein [Streptomyces sp. SP18CS02]MEE1755488.1 nuclear transport factor 2 family protein [Streptomyces sp. SP18CS02]